jgi:hypothetical protein
VEKLVLNCPTINNTVFKNNFNQEYNYSCGIDLGNLLTDSGAAIVDLGAVVAYTVEDCLDACSALTFQTMLSGRENGPTCTSISWFANARAVVSVGNGNCWLKSGVLAAGQTGNTASNAVSAQIV